MCVQVELLQQRQDSDVLKPLAFFACANTCFHARRYSLLADHYICDPAFWNELDGYLATFSLWLIFKGSFKYLDFGFLA